MKLKVIFFTALFAIAISAHADVQWSATTPASEAEYAPYLVAGKNTLVGQAFLTQKGGGVVKAAGRAVTLDPATSIGTDWWTNAGMKWANRLEVHSSTNFSKARRLVIADADGKFTFKNLPAGSYYLRTDITWEVASDIQGGLVGQLVEIKGNDTTEIILGNLNQIAIATITVVKPPVQRVAQVAQPSVSVPSLNEMLTSDIPQNMKDAAMDIYKNKKFQPERLTLLRTIIEKHYKQPLSKDYIDATVWLCHALAASRVVEYKPFIADVAENAAEAKVRSQVKKFLEYYN